MHFAFIRRVEPHKLITFLLFLEFLNYDGPSVKEQIILFIFTTIFFGEKIQKLFIFTILFVFRGWGEKIQKIIFSLPFFRGEKIKIFLFSPPF